MKYAFGKKNLFKIIGDHNKKQMIAMISNDNDAEKMLVSRNNTNLIKTFGDYSQNLIVAIISVNYGVENACFIGNKSYRSIWRSL